MKIVFGLGNPGKRYAETRHNAGAIVLSYCADKLGVSFEKSKKFSSYIAELNKEGEKALFAIPDTYMNLSGIPVKKLVDYFKVPISEILVIYDDFNIPLGTIRIRKQGSSGGHNGVESIISHLGSNGFNRLRVGIKTEFFDDIRKVGSEAITSFVLGKFCDEEKEILSSVMDDCCESILLFLENNLEKAMNRFNRKA